MDRRVAIAVAVALLAALSLSGAVEGVERPDEDRVELDLNPGSADAVTIYLDEREGDPVERAEALAADAGLPVEGVTTETVGDPVTVRYNGHVVDGGESYTRVTIETALGERTGPFEREISAATLGAVSPTAAPEVTVETPRGLAVDPSEGRSGAGLVAVRHDVSESAGFGSSGIVYGISGWQVALLGAALVGSFLVPYVLFRSYARDVAAAEAPVEERLHWLDRAQLGTGLVVLVSLGVALWLGALGVLTMLVESLLPATPGGAWWRVTLGFAAFAPFAGAAWLAPAAAIAPVRSQLRETGVTRPAAIGNAGREFLATAGAAWIAILVLVALPAGLLANPFTAALVVGGLLLSYTAAGPWLVRLFDDVEPMPEPARTEVARICDEEGIGVRGLYALDTGADRHANAIVAGLPGLRSLFLTDDLLERAEPGRLRAIVAHELGHAAGGHLLRRVAFATAFWAAGLWVATGLWGPGWWSLCFVGACYLTVGRGWIACRQEYRADAYAAAATDPETVADALEELARINESKRETDRLYELLMLHPSLADRIERLREDQVDAEPAAADASR